MFNTYDDEDVKVKVKFLDEDNGDKPIKFSISKNASTNNE